MNPYTWRHTKPTNVRNKPGYIRSLLQLVYSVTRFLLITTKINWNFWKTLRWVYTVACQVTTSCILCSEWLHDIRCGNTSKRWWTTILSVCMVYQYLMIRYQTLLLLLFSFNLIFESVQRAKKQFITQQLHVCTFVTMNYLNASCTLL